MTGTGNINMLAAVSSKSTPLTDSCTVRGPEGTSAKDANAGSVHHRDVEDAY
jgi:hypothetical protein